MLLKFIGDRLSLRPDVSVIILMFFIYSFLGYILECVVLSLEKKKLVLNRGFTNHLPFCIIYGFGGMLCFGVLGALRNNLLLLFIVGAVGATLLELFVAKLQIRMFGNFWWDYNRKPLNYKGIICLESTLGWGIVAIFIVRFFHINLAGILLLIPKLILIPAAFLLFFGYLIDFVYTTYMEKNPELTLENQR